MTPLYSDFNREEFDSRYARARSMMAEQNLDALLITERTNYIYFTGHRSCQNPIDKIRPFVFILPRDGDPIMIFAAFECAQVQQTVFVKDIRPFGALLDQAKFIVEALKDAGLTRGRIGCELGREQYLGISWELFGQIKQSLSDAQFVDASGVILALRVIKSPTELQYLREASRITVTAELETAAAMRIGMTEREVAHMLREALMKHGAEEITFLCVISPVPGYRGICPLPTDRTIGPDELIGFDVGVSYRGYCSDIARSIFTGEPSVELLEFYGWMMDVQRACIDMLSPGRTPRDVIRVCNSMLAERKQPTMGAGRIGHGVGLESTEYPSLAEFEQIEFQPGMVFACNPNFVNRFGFVNSEDNWFIDDKGAKPLSEPIGSRSPILVTP
jgi:Xaa-Pro aminopeptidase